MRLPVTARSTPTASHSTVIDPISNIPASSDHTGKKSRELSHALPSDFIKYLRTNACRGEVGPDHTATWDDCVQTILKGTTEEPMSAAELTEICAASRATVYCRLDGLPDRGLLVEQTVPNTDGHHRTVYAATLDHVIIDITDGEFLPSRNGNELQISLRTSSRVSTMGETVIAQIGRGRYRPTSSC